MFLRTKMRKGKSSSSAKRRIKGLIKCLLDAQHLAGVPCATPALTALARVRGSLLFASSVHFQPLNWAATSNTCINHPRSGGFQGRERGPGGISCKGPQRRAGLVVAEVRAQPPLPPADGAGGARWPGTSDRRRRTGGLTRLTG